MSQDHTTLAITLQVPTALWIVWEQDGLAAPMLLQRHGLWPAFLEETLWSYRCGRDNPVGWVWVQITFRYCLPSVTPLALEEV